MKSYNANSTKRSLPWAVVTVFIAIIILLGGGILAVRQVYLRNLKPVNASQRTTTVLIKRGASTKEISALLKKDNLIRSVWSFDWYVRSKEVRDALQAGTYELRPSQTVPEIVEVLTQGKIATDLVTILPDQRLGQIRDRLVSSGFKAAEVDAALSPSLYKSHPALVDKPAAASLEGYLYPDSFQKSSDTKPETIIRASLDQMEKRLTPELRAAINQQGLSVYEGIKLASIIEKEVSSTEDRAQVAQVFLKRLRSGMVLGSDVTAYYGSVIAGLEPSLRYDSPYNTHLHAGLPPGPISNVTESSLYAVAHPASGDFVYFVAGDDGRTYFSRTLDEHESMVAQHCKKLCSL